MSFLAAEKLFWESVQDNRRMAKAWAKPKHRNILIGWLKMKPDEVIAAVEKYGIKVTRRTLLNYEKWGLVPEAVRGNAGRGKGRTADYPDETPAEFYASVTLKQQYGYRVEIISLYRMAGLEMEGNITTARDPESKKAESPSAVKRRADFNRKYGQKLGINKPEDLEGLRDTLDTISRLSQTLAETIGTAMKPLASEVETGGQAWLRKKHFVLHDGQHDTCPICQNLEVK